MAGGANAVNMWYDRDIDARMGRTRLRPIPSALVKQKDYGRVGVPMGPNVWEERRTLRQMLRYTLLLVPTSVAPAFLGHLGPLYGAGALLLGVWLLHGVMRLRHAADIAPPAWVLYRNSLLYLALLSAMALDALLLP